YRQLWWKTGNIHPKAKWEEATLPYELKTGVTLDEYIIQIDKHNVKGLWEWENGTVRVIELSSGFHGESIGTIIGELGVALRAVKCTPSSVTISDATTSRTKEKGTEPDASLIPARKPQMFRGGYDGKNTPWPNIVIEVAYSENLKDKIENY
ncbi:6323_t:CDS:2, partial [Paraglomus occultum]